MKIGVIIINIFLVITLLIWGIPQSSIFQGLDGTLRNLTQISALLGSVLLSIEYLLATRSRWITSLFEGFDDVYKVHHIVGGLAYSFLIIHPLLLILKAFSTPTVALLYIIPGSVWSYNWGILAFYTLSILIIVTLFMRLPYHIWKFTHNLMGIPILLGLLHAFMIESDISNNLLLRYWILGWLFIGIFAFLYKRFLYNYLTRTYRYKISQINTVGDIVEVALKPVDNHLVYKPGQFAYFTFLSKGFPSESHPFTIASAPNSSELRVAIKTVGDYTNQMDKLVVGTDVKVKGPYGKFGHKYLENHKDSVWIAGGIGITPFLSMLDTEIISENDREVTFFYCTQTPEMAYFNNEITNKVTSKPSIKYINHLSSVDGHLTAESIATTLTSLKGKKYFICGPIAMMQSITEQLIQSGVRSRDIILEDFDLLQ